MTIAKSKSPAEFFAENQNIAGFDNPGKALYTTIRELVENSLDAAEMIRVLPSVEVTLTELRHDTFAAIRGLDSIGERFDHTLYKKKQKGKDGTKSLKKAIKQQHSDAGNEINEPQEEEENVTVPKGGRDEHFFKLTCRDNGSGMIHDQVPGMFGRVLSGSNYAVKQARGKFGLGAKMALIWSKKSTGLPIEVTTAYSKDALTPPTFTTYCKIDIDIYKNTPKVHIHEKLDNEAGWRGSEVSLVMSGNWTTYKRRILDYIQQLAVITPYANLTFKFNSEVQEKKNFKVSYMRRSEQLCSLAQEVKRHPKSVDDLIVRQLLNNLTKASSTTLSKFLSSQFSCINAPLAQRLVGELEGLSKGELNGETTCENLSDKKVHLISQLLRDTTAFPDPKIDCLSPAGEYNLRLGIMKEFNPELIATACSKPVVYNGHPAFVEAAVALGSTLQKKPGLSIFRFANRIPLLFEPGSDVVTIVSNKNVRWAAYLINPNTDKVSVFVSIVSTKIPFKGTGKEFIGADVEPIREAVHECIVKCASQLKAKVAQKRQAKERANRINNLVRYIPDVSKAFYEVIAQMKSAKGDSVSGNEKKRRKSGQSAIASSVVDESAEATTQDHMSILAKIEKDELSGDELSSEILKQRLEEAVSQADLDSTLEQEKKRGRGELQRVSLFLVPGAPNPKLMNDSISHPLLKLRLYSGATEFPSALD